MSNTLNSDRHRVHALDTQYSKLYSAVPLGALQSNSLVGVAGANVVPPNMLFNHAAGFTFHVTDGTGSLTPLASITTATTFQMQDVAAGENAAVVLMGKLGLENVGDSAVLRFWIYGETGVGGSIALDFKGSAAGTEFLDTAGSAITNGVLELVGASSGSRADTKTVVISKASATTVMINSF